MSEKPELPSADALRKAMIPQERGGVLDRMARAQHEALREPWCKAIGCVRGLTIPATGDYPKPCEACEGTGLNPYAHAVLERGEAAGLGSAAMEEREQQ